MKSLWWARTHRSGTDLCHYEWSVRCPSLDVPAHLRKSRQKKVRLWRRRRREYSLGTFTFQSTRGCLGSLIKISLWTIGLEVKEVKNSTRRNLCPEKRQQINEYQSERKKRVCFKMMTTTTTTPRKLGSQNRTPVAPKEKKKGRSAGTKRPSRKLLESLGGVCVTSRGKSERGKKLRDRLRSEEFGAGSGKCEWQGCGWRLWGFAGRLVGVWINPM